MTDGTGLAHALSVPKTGPLAHRVGVQECALTAAAASPRGPSGRRRTESPDTVKTTPAGCAGCGMRAGRDSARTVPDPWFMKSLGSKANGPRLERMKASPRWAGEGFRNRHPILPGLRDPTAPMPTWSDFLCAQERGIPARALPALDPLETWRRRPGSGLRATWLGHSTVVIEIDGVRVLTDPVWGPRASPLRLAGPKRFQPVPVALRAMPPVTSSSSPTTTTTTSTTRRSARSPGATCRS